MLREYKRDPRFENEHCAPYLSDWDPDAANDIKLLSGKNSCTAQTDSDVVDNKDN